MVRDRAKPSMMISAKLQFFLKNLVNQVINLEHIPMELLAFYAWRKTHIKSSRSYMERRSGAHCFC
jgi:hypothetical protein